MTTPSYLLSTTGCERIGSVCFGCAESAKQAPSGRWFVTMGHPGFNTPANNRNGYATRAAAVATVARYASKRA